MGIMEAKFENAQRVLEADLQSTMEKQVMHRISVEPTEHYNNIICKKSLFFLLCLRLIDNIITTDCVLYQILKGKNLKRFALYI